MFKPSFTIQELIEITNGEIVGNIDQTTLLTISTDTRTITEKDCYLAICGATFDGHNFVEVAFNSNSKLAIIDENHKNLCKKIQGNFLIVKNTLEAYLNIAKFHKNRCKAKIIGVTGSSGKTTTKEFLFSVFNALAKTKKSIKNHNNEIGLCQTLLSIEPDTEFCIVEMGMRALGEIDLLAKYSTPDVAVITNAGTAHIGILGSRENIAKAKCEITNYLTTNGVLIAHNEDLIKETINQKYNSNPEFETVFYDLSQVKVLEKTENSCKFEYDNFVFEIPDSADFNILNALASINAGKSQNYTYDEIQKGLLEFKNIEFRNEITMLKNGATVISDCYNANPESAKASIKHICEVYKNKKIIIVFGDMFELGEFEESYHREIGKLINELNVNYFVSVGKLAKITSEEVQNTEKESFDTLEAAAEFLTTIADQNSLIFLKASRGMKFEKILEIIKEK